MKINFRKITVVISFSGEKKTFDVAENVGNMMMYNGSVLLDIGFEDLAKAIYYNNGETEIPEKYAPAMKEIIRESNFIAAVKRDLIEKLNNK